MASTAAGNTRVELQGTGDNAGTWGTKANTVFQIFDRVTSGYGSSVAVADGDTTLSVTDYTLATWHYQVWNVTGALTASANLIVPNYGKFWAVVNATTGSQTLTVKVTGQTGVVIPDGGWAILYNNGTDVAKLIDSDDYQVADADLTAVAALSSTGLAARTGSGTWAVRTLTGPAAGISVANGDGVAGNPTLSLANDLAALEALSSTGIAVRTASDTWAQRTLTGTSAEITVTNGDGVSGNPTLSLPTALTFTGKTVTGGTFSAVAISGASTFSGTTVAATTSVTTPSVTNAGTLALSATGANVITFATNGSERARLDGTGFGVGTTSPAAQFEGYSTAQYGAAMLLGNNSPYIGLRYTGSSNALVLSAASATNDQVTGAAAGDAVIRHDAARLLIARSTSAIDAVIDASGNVVIGHTSAARRLEVNDASNNFQLRLGAGATASANTYDLGRNGSDGLFHFYGNQTGFVGYVFEGIDGERARIDSSGNFLIGTTSGSNKLTVAGSVALTGGDGTYLSWDAAGGSQYVKLDTTLNGLKINGFAGLVFETGAGSERLRIDSSGNVGIGTTTMTGLFNVDAGGVTTIGAFGGSATNGSWFEYLYSGSAYGYIGSGSNLVTGAATTDFVMRATANLIFGISNVEVARIDSSGRFVLGTSSGTSIFTIQGSVAVPNASTGGVGGDASYGLQLIGYGSVGDVTLYNRGGSVVATVPTNTTNFQIVGNLGIGGAPTSTSKLNITGLPTSSAGLATGDVWLNGGVLTSA